MSDPFTIRIYVPDGDPEGVRIIDRMNWTGLGIVFPRGKWPEVRQRWEQLRGAGVYILVGYGNQDDDLPTIYIGQTENVQVRIDQHNQTKEFWDRAVVLTSSSRCLNRAHVTWLEHALIKQANEANRCTLENGTTPPEPALNEADKAETRAFFKGIHQMLPLVGLRAFEIPKAIAEPRASDPALAPQQNTIEADTIIVPAQKENFERLFLGQDCWYAVRISGGMLDKIKYIAGYQTLPVSAITHYAPVSRIEPYGEDGKFKLIFSGKANPIGPIPYADAPLSAMLGPRYTAFARLQTARKLADLLPK